MPRNWNDEEEDYNEEEEVQSQGSRSRSRSPHMSRNSGIVTGTKARDICNDPDSIGSRICVMDLNQSVDKEIIEEYFSQFGRVVAIYILRNKRNAFVQYEDEEDARECLNAGETAQFGDVEAIVKPAKQGGDSSKSPQKNQNKGNKNKSVKKKALDFNDTSTADSRVFVDPVNGAINKGDIEDEMSQFGRVLGVQIQSRKDKNMPRYAFVQFADMNSAQNCIARKNMSIKGFNLMVRSVTSSNKKDEPKRGKSYGSPMQMPIQNQIKPKMRSVPDVRGNESTSDPTTANARVYVGNIQGDNITRDDLRNYFCNFGIVMNVSLHKTKNGKKGFAFVQYSDEEGAQNCLLVGKNIFINGQQLEIGPVKGGDQSANTGMGNSGISPWDMQQTVSNLNNQFGMSNFMPQNNQMMGAMSGLGMGNSSTSMSQNVADMTGVLDPDRPNDAEIIVASVTQRSYAEYIESQLLALNMKVDMIFPPPNLSTSKIVTDLIKRKCLFAVMITEENEMRNSVTLHVLQGPLQAHCNIPISNAMRLIEENFMDYIQVVQQQQMVNNRGMQNMGQGMFGGNNFGSNSGNGLFGSAPSNFGDSQGMPAMGSGNSNNGLLGPVPNDGGSLMGPVPSMGGSGPGAGGGDMGNMYSLVLDSVKMARELRNSRGNMDVKEIMAGRDFQDRVAALKAKANAVKQQGRMGGGGMGAVGQSRYKFF